MYKKLTAITLTFAAVTSMTAKQITADEALARLNSTSQLPATAKTHKSAPLVEVKTIYTSDNSAALYLYKSAETLFILPADDQVNPLLGYTTNVASADNLPSNVSWWLNEYARQIEYLQSQQQTISLKPAKARELTYGSIDPMLTTLWNQGAPYNNQCPTINETVTYTGCVATAATQVMKYFNYPECGTGTVTATDTNGTSYSMTLDEQNFDWNNMLDSYSGSYTEQQANAVAYLMKSVGYAASTQYGTSASGATSPSIYSAFINNFSYNENARLLEREFYDYYDWVDLVYNNLKNVGPVPYFATDLSAGHAFVCDGYSSNGYFHINWGWGGSYNGYFLLSALTPDGQGIGGNVGGYNFDQQAIFNLTTPDKSTNELPQTGPLALIGNLRASSYDSSQSRFTIYSDIYNVQGYSFRNYDPQHSTFYIKAKLVNVETNEEIISESISALINMGLMYSAKYSYLSISTSGLSEGTYRIYPLVSAAGEDNYLELSHNPACTNYFYATFNSDGTFEQVASAANDKAAPEISNLKLDTKFISGTNFKFSYNITNKSDDNVFVGLIPVVFTVSTSTDEDTKTETDTENSTNTEASSILFTASSGSTTTVIGKGSPVSMIIDAGDSTDAFYISNISLSSDYSGTTYFGLVSYLDYSLVAYTPITVEEATTTGLQATKFEIVGDVDYADANELYFNCTMTCNEGYFYDYLYLVITDTSNNVLQIFTSDDMYMLNAGESASAKIGGMFIDGVEGCTYNAYFATISSSTIKAYAWKQIKISTAVTGVNDVKVDTECSVNVDRSTGAIAVNAPTTIKSIEAYTIDGRACNINASISGDEATASIQAAPRGIIILKVTLANGATHITKIAPAKN